MRAKIESDGITAAIGSTKQQSTLKDREQERGADEPKCFSKEKGPQYSFFKNLHSHLILLYLNYFFNNKLEMYTPNNKNKVVAVVTQ